MFIKGTIHGVALSALAILIAFLSPYLTMESDLLKLFNIILLATPLLCIGYKFRSKIEVPLIEYIIYKDHGLWLYLLGAGLITAIASTILKIYFEGILEFNALTVVITYALSMFSNTATIGTIIFIGSSLNRKP